MVNCVGEISRYSADCYGDNTALIVGENRFSFQEKEASQSDLVNFCKERLAAYKVPRAVQFVDSVPQTSSGKIMRRLLSEIDDGSLSS